MDEAALNVMVTVSGNATSTVPAAADVLAALKALPELSGGDVAFSVIVNKAQTDVVHEGVGIVDPMP